RPAVRGGRGHAGADPPRDGRRRTVSGGQVVAMLPLAGSAALPVPCPRRRQRGATTAPAAPAEEKRLELDEDRATVCRALRELDFDHEAGHLADDDYHALRAVYEAGAAAA